MARFEVIRNNRQNINFMKDTIHMVWDNPENLCRWNPNVIGETSDAICRLFSMTQNAWGKSLFVKIHCFVLDFEEVQDRQAIKSIISYILQYFETNYHIIAALRKSQKGSYEAVFIINAVSYRTGFCFHDRNSIYVNLLDSLRDRFPIPWNIRAGNTLFFKNDGNHQNCYIDLQNMKGNE